jgi:transcriptional antiterminator NusG
VTDEPKHATDESVVEDALAASTDSVVGGASGGAAGSDSSADSAVPVDAALTTAPADSDEDDEKPTVTEEEQDFAEWADDGDLDALNAEYEADDSAEDGGDVAPLEEVSDDDPNKPEIDERPVDWYILKVQSNRETSIADALRRRVKVAGLEEYFDEIIVPTEMVTEFKGGKKKVVKRKLYPGYIVVHMIINDETWFLVRETPGIGDFTGSAGRPTPMLATEVARIVQKDEDVEADEPKLQIAVNLGDRVKINEGTFENFEGDVDSIDVTNGRVTVMINIFGRSTPVELEYWQIETV